MTRNPAIVVDVDESQASRDALRRALNQSLLTGLPLRVQHEWWMTDLAAAPTTGYAQACAADARARATQWVLETLGEDEGRCRWTLELNETAAPPVVTAPRA